MCQDFISERLHVYKCKGLPVYDVHVFSSQVDDHCSVLKAAYKIGTKIELLFSLS